MIAYPEMVFVIAIGDERSSRQIFVDFEMPMCETVVLAGMIRQTVPQTALRVLEDGFDAEIRRMNEPGRQREARPFTMGKALPARCILAPLAPIRSIPAKMFRGIG